MMNPPINHPHLHVDPSVMQWDTLFFPAHQLQAVAQRAQQPAMTAFDALPRHTAFLWGAFLLDGLFDAGRLPFSFAPMTDHSAGDGQTTAQHPLDDRGNAVMDIWPQGFDTLIEGCCQRLAELWQQTQPYAQHPMMAFPSMFEYLVVSPFGEYLAQYLLSHQGQLPDQAEVAAQVTRQLQGFFHPLDEEDEQKGYGCCHYDRHATY